MRGHLVKRSKDSWTIVLSVGRDPATGKRKQQWIAVKGTKKDAERRLAELIHQIDGGTPLDRSRLSLRDYLETWLQDVVAVRVRPRTLNEYATIVRKHIIPQLGATQLTKLQPSDVEHLEAKLLVSGLSANTVHHVHVILAKALKDGVRKGQLQRNVCQAVEPPKVPRYEVKVPDAQSISRILELSKDIPYYSVLHVMAFTGCRRGEAIALKWRNVDLSRAVLSITETAQRLRQKGIVFQPTKSAAGRRGVAIDPATIEILRAHQGLQLLRKMEIGAAYNDHDLVFPGPLGEPLDPSVLTRNFERLAKKAGCAGMRLHDLRHGHASELIRAGIHPRVVQERLGHASAAFTMQVYGHVAAGLQAEAARAFAELMAKSGG